MKHTTPPQSNGNHGGVIEANTEGTCYPFLRFFLEIARGFPYYKSAKPVKDFVVSNKPSKPKTS